MARGATINVSLTPAQLRLVRERLDSGHYESASEVIRQSLRMMFEAKSPQPPPSTRQLKQRLASGYRAMATHDRKLARDWSKLPETWPEK
jgi:putative addiction module CopG family antidote